MVYGPMINESGGTPTYNSQLTISGNVTVIEGTYSGGQYQFSSNNILAFTAPRSGILYAYFQTSATALADGRYSINIAINNRSIARVMERGAIGTWGFFGDIFPIWVNEGDTIKFTKSSSATGVYLNGNSSAIVY
jgi:hypothetical protein